MMWTAFLLAAVALALAQIFIFTGREKRLIEEFHRWVAENATALQSTTASYRDVELDLNSEVTQFQAVFSFVKFTVTLESRPYFVGRDSIVKPALVATTCSVVFGWWGIPWGPIETVTAVFLNLSGGKRQRIRDLVAQATRHSRTVFRLTPAAADEARRVIAEQRFAATTALRLVPVEPTVGDYEIQYDLPDNDGRDWQSESEGLTLLVDKRAVEQSDLGDIVVDFQEGRFAFDRAWDKYQWGGPKAAE